uniref:Uncharacterized protein n=1 Tax=Rhizophora mucronata TaxID=61149 RepID=A0A2P2J2N4_RHIMU
MRLHSTLNSDLPNYGLSCSQSNIFEALKCLSGFQNALSLLHTLYPTNYKIC